MILTNVPGEDDIEEAISWTKQAGLRYLYHPEPFDCHPTWPDGDDFYYTIETQTEGGFNFYEGLYYMYYGDSGIDAEQYWGTLVSENVIALNFGYDEGLSDDAFVKD